MSKISEIEISKKLLKWYDKGHRNLPWRDKLAPNLPYRVWVSEIMLQQTKVDTVIKYFNKWMEKFPTIKDLSTATLEDVHSVWAGLGYYRRATNFHKAAKQIFEEFNGEIPSDAKSLLKLAGIGKYTAGAISSIAFKQIEPLVDGNVIRVLSRQFLIDKDIKETKVVNEFWSIAGPLVDQERPGDYNEALMELGATICTPKSPKCNECPISETCKAFSHKKDGKIDSIEIYPRKSKKSKKEQSISCIVLSCKKKYLIQKRPKEGLLASLWEFPNFEVESEQGKEEVEEFLNELDVFIDDLQYIGEIQHIFTHIKQKIFIYSLEIKDEKKLEDQEHKWVKKEEFNEMAVSTQMKKVFVKSEGHEKGITKYFKKKKE